MGSGYRARARHVGWIASSLRRPLSAAIVSNILNVLAMLSVIFLCLFCVYV